MNPSPVQARKMVLVSMVLLVAIAVFRSSHGEGGSLYRRVWGTGVLSMMLSLAADFVPTVAGPFAVLVVLGSLTNGGDAAIQNLLGRLGGAEPPSSSSSSSPVQRTAASNTPGKAGGPQ